MIEGRTIVCIANDWDYDPTSKHQIMRILARRNHVIWVNYHGTRRPSASRRDLGAAWVALRRAGRGVQRVNDHMVQFTPLVLPGVGPRLQRRFQERLLVKQIRRVLRRTGSDGRPVQVWTFAPDVAIPAGALGEECLLYYCVDEYSAFDGFDGQAIRRAELDLIRRADVVITTSQALFANKRRLHPHTHLVRHGVDVAHFHSALNGVPTPPDMRELRAPVLGFFGLIHDWFDTKLVEAVARRRPQATFVLIGDARVDVTSLRALPNVRLLGRRPYGELPGYCRAFDAALLPFRRSEMTRHINPIKLREYLAAGLPTISTSLPEARRYEPDVLIADDPEMFARACDAVPGMNAPAQRLARSGRVAGESWEAVVERLSTIVEAGVARGPILSWQKRDVEPQMF